VEHRKKLWPLDETDYIGLALVAIVQASELFFPLFGDFMRLCSEVSTAGGGIGAGAILVPLFIWVMGFPQALGLAFPAWRIEKFWLRDFWLERGCGICCSQCCI
jgi:hypothetical protein